MTVSSYFASSAGDGSWVEHATNISYLPGFEFSRHLRPFLTGRLPPELQAPFLHEMTHHWCFDSPLGWTLSLLRFRLLGGSVSEAAGAASAQVGDALWMDISRYEVAVELLRPIIEGLALFVENDAEMDGEFSYSVPLLGMNLLVARHVTDLLAQKGVAMEEAELVAFIPKAAMTLLKSERQGAAGVERKADLLASPIDPRHPLGHYLIGYLTLRLMWKWARGKTELMHNSDLFASYIRTYFFHDWGLVNAILADADGEIELATRIAQYLQRRLNWLLLAPSEEFDAQVRDWDEHADESRTPASIILFDDGTTEVGDFGVAIAGINTDWREKARGESLLRTGMAWFNYLAEEQEEVRIIKRWALRRFVQRSVMPVVHEEGAIEACEDGEARFVDSAGRLAFTFVPNGPLPPGRHPAIAELLYSPTSRDSAVLVLQDGKLVGGEIPDALAFLHEGEKILPSFASVQEIKTLEVWERGHGKVMRDQRQAYSILFSHIVESAPKAVGDVYLPYVALMLGQEDVDTMPAATLETGIRALLDGDGELLRSLARLGLMAGHGVRMASLEKRFAAAGDDLNRTLEKLEAARGKYGFRSFWRVEDAIMPLV